MITPYAAVVTTLAVARVTRLITADYLLRGPRNRLILRWGTQSMRAYLLTCPWCMSIWVGAAAAPAAWYWSGRPWFLIPATALALSHATGLLARGEDD